ncbi:hypothetical protein CLOACE_20130 [Clostridium acetireducens DSM 10703]|jgi:CxxC motif-containing protein|uniref:4Fe-4S Mo/W bis-MGD-type domain-containing protein n=1 Tax=Clostridium acetireducens DSM 10703 TaxID=1121290 RepID=A0A1E8EX97_9CLOT|nr:DUF1667 domain-containing protein [Clostridium acetireducens]OFI04993.1 hypothetical protein CLOACE_20130 [Clostridium acetireducens DSM 10703]
MIRKIICKQCKKNCVIEIEVNGDNIKIINNPCEKALNYINNRLLGNKHIFTTIVRAKGAMCNVVPVKSSKPIDRKLWFDCSKALSRLYVGAPINIGDVVCKNILNTSIDILCTKNIKK